MGDLKKFFKESIDFNWSMLVDDDTYYLNLKSMTTYQKIDELYDMLIYFLDNEEYEKCSVIINQIKKLKELYKNELIDKGYDKRTSEIKDAGIEQDTRGKAKER